MRYIERPSKDGEEYNILRIRQSVLSLRSSEARESNAKFLCMDLIADKHSEVLNESLDKPWYWNQGSNASVGILT